MDHVSNPVTVPIHSVSSSRGAQKSNLGGVCQGGRGLKQLSHHCLNDGLPVEVEPTSLIPRILLAGPQVTGAVVNINFAEVVERRIFFNFIAPHCSTRVETLPGVSGAEFGLVPFASVVTSICAGTSTSTLQIDKEL